MIISFTGVVYSILSAGLIIIDWLFYRSWKREDALPAKILFFSSSAFTIVCMAPAIGGIFFAQSPEIIKLVLVVSGFFVGLGNAILGYLIFKLKFPRFSPWTGFLGILCLGTVVTILTAVIPFSPCLEKTGGIWWGLPLWLGFLRVFLYFLGCLPFSFILFKEFRKSTDINVRAKSLTLAAFFTLAPLVAFEDFIIEPVFHIEALISEVLIVILSIFIALIYFLSKKLRPPKYVRKVD